MKVLLKKASDWDFYKIIDINNLDELLKIYHSLIIESDKDKIDIYKRSNKSKFNKDFDVVITIYDDYVE